MLDKSSRKFLCPQCGKRKLVRYVDSKKGELQSSEFGRCDREDSCGYFLYPKADWKEYSKVAHRLAIRQETQLKKEMEQVYIPREALDTTLSGYDECSFFLYLRDKGIPDSVLEKVIEMYYLGTINSGHLRGALSIPFIDTEGNIVYAQVKMFDESNKTIMTSALHSHLKYISGNDWVKEYEKNEQKVTCFFGAHLLAMYPNNPIVLVEAPKTALYGTCYYGPPKTDNDLLWLAVYSKSSLTEEKFKILEGRNIILIPDLSTDSATFKDWSEKAKRFANKLKRTTVGFFDFLERNAPKELIKAGGDFADYLAQFSWEQFNQHNLSDESGESDPEKKHFSGSGNLETLRTVLMRLFQPQTGYSTEAIVELVSPIEYFRKLNDYQIIAHLIEIKFIEQDYERDNYYLSGSTPF